MKKLTRVLLLIPLLFAPTVWADGYAETTWVDGSGPAINADNLNKIELGIQSALGYETVQNLRDAGTPTSVQTAYVRCHSTCQDGAEGWFIWRSSVTDADDDGITLLPTGHVGAGRWVRQFTGPVNALWYGPDTTGTTSAVTEIQAAYDQAQSTGGTLYIPHGTYLIDSALTHSGEITNVKIMGDGMHYDGQYTKLIADSGFTDAVFAFDSATHRIGNVVFEDFIIDCNTEAATGVEFHNSLTSGTAQNIQFVRFDRMNITGCDRGIDYGGNWDDYNVLTTIISAVIENSFLRDNKYQVYSEAGGFDGFVVRSSFITDPNNRMISAISQRLTGTVINIEDVWITAGSSAGTVNDADGNPFAVIHTNIEVPLTIVNSAIETQGTDGTWVGVFQGRSTGNPPGGLSLQNFRIRMRQNDSVAIDYDGSFGAILENVWLQGDFNVGSTITDGALVHTKNVVFGDPNTGYVATSYTGTNEFTGLTQIVCGYEFDYTPELKFGGADTGITYGTQQGQWTRNGDTITYDAQIVLTNKGSATGTATVSTPSARVQNVSGYSPIMNTYLDGMTTAIGPMQSAGIPTLASITLYALNLSTGNAAVLDDADFANTSTVRISGSYITDR